jgi:predicted transcriptional regulator
METLTSTQKLDAVLDYFATTEIKNILLFRIARDLAYNEEMIGEIVDRLMQDGLVKAQYNPDPTGAYNTYKITFDGRDFYDQGGYIERERTNDLKDEYLETAERLRKRNENWVAKGTWAAAVVGVALLAWQFWLWFYPTHADYQNRNSPKKSIEKSK